MHTQIFIWISSPFPPWVFRRTLPPRGSFDRRKGSTKPMGFSGLVRWGGRNSTRTPHSYEVWILELQAECFFWGVAKNQLFCSDIREIKPPLFFFGGILIQLGIGDWDCLGCFFFGGNITYHLGFDDVILVGWWQLKDSWEEFSSPKRGFTDPILSQIGGTTRMSRWKLGSMVRISGL